MTPMTVIVVVVVAYRALTPLKPYGIACGSDVEFADAPLTRFNGRR